jgi:hypothetical protein
MVTSAAAVNRILTKVLIVSGIVTIAFGCAFAATLWLAHRTDAYAVAVRKLRASSELVAAVGEIRSTRLSWIDHVSIEELEIDGKLTGNAVFTVIVEGASGTTEVSMQLARNQHGWAVTRAATERSLLKLESPFISAPASSAAGGD